jgi:glycosyltransferase involved in cell wall biosynthesis
MPTILYVNHTSQISGAENSLLDLLKGLDLLKALGREWNPVVACPGGGPLLEQLEARAVRVMTVPLVRFRRTACPLTLAGYFLAWRRGIARLRKAIREEGAHAVHSNSTIAHLYGGQAARSCSIPSIWHVRDAVVPGIAKLFLPRPNACIAISRFIARQIERDTGLEADLIYNGVDLERFSPAERSAETPTVAMVGQLVPWKNHCDFLRAAARVHQAIPAARFLIVGDDLFGDHPRYREELTTLAEDLGIAPVVQFAGYRRDVPELLRSVSVLVVPSRREPFGRVIVEAMASAVPVVAYREGGPAEVIVHEETGLLVRPGDVEAMATAVARLLNDPAQARRFGEAGRARAARMFDHRRAAEHVEAIYSRLLGCTR